MVKVRDRWFDLTTVHMTRPFIESDRSRFRMFFETFDVVQMVGNEASAGLVGYFDKGEMDGGVDTWVRRWHVRKYERQGWRRA